MTKRSPSHQTDDGFSRQYLTERFAQQGFAVVCSPVSEWIRYSDYCVQNDPENWQQLSLGQKMRFKIRQLFMNRYGKLIFGTLSKTGLVHNGKNLETVLHGMHSLSFLVVESDGSPFPPAHRGQAGGVLPPGQAPVWPDAGKQHAFFVMVFRQIKPHPLCIDFSEKAAFCAWGQGIFCCWSGWPRNRFQR